MFAGLAAVMLILFSSFSPLAHVQKVSASKKTLHQEYQPVLFHIFTKTPKDTIKIMPLGDSITEGVNSYQFGGYRVVLWQLAQAAGWHVQFVGSVQRGPASLPDKHNEGHSGWRIDQISAKIVPWLRKTHPQIILLHIGTNDLRQGDSISVALDRLSTLIDQITSTQSDAVLVVAQIAPQRDPAINAKVVQYDNAIPALVAQKVAHHKKVEYVDMYDAVPVNYISDHIHPNTAGYALMAHVWYRALTSIIQKEAV